MPVEIIEVLDRSVQGMTLPFICRGDDGKIYFVKGRSAGRRSLLCEWIAGHLAIAFGLPIAPFSQVYVSEPLIQLASRSDIGDLGEGLAFGSEGQQTVELTVTHLIAVGVEVRRDVLAFDWWVKNGDRTQSALGGNPNLFWNISSDSLLVIDHNQAFDESFDEEAFFSLHPFRDRIFEVFDDMVYRDHYASKFESVMAGWDQICDTIPPEWWFVDPECTMPLEFDREALKRRLLDCRSDAFWAIK